MEHSAYILLEKGKPFILHSIRDTLTDNFSDGNIRYFEYENDKFEFLSEYKSGDPQRGIAFVPRRGINVRRILGAFSTFTNTYRSTKTKS